MSVAVHLLPHACSKEFVMFSSPSRILWLYNTYIGWKTDYETQDVFVRILSNWFQVLWCRTSTGMTNHPVA
jgi:hypothetical protein